MDANKYPNQPKKPEDDKNETPGEMPEIPGGNPDINPDIEGNPDQLNHPDGEREPLVSPDDMPGIPVHAPDKMKSRQAGTTGSHEPGSKGSQQRNAMHSHDPGSTARVKDRFNEIMDAGKTRAVAGWTKLRGARWAELKGMGTKVKEIRWRNINRRKVALFASLATFGLLAAAVLIPVLVLRFSNLPDVAMLDSHQPVEAIKIYDRYDQLAAVVAGEEDRQVVPITSVSKNMQKAIMAAEDHTFYEHGGINPTSIMRALIVNMQAGRVVEGGSTITQQLVKNVFFPKEDRTIMRKIKEFFLANEVDQRYSKDKILEMYLNQIYFGNKAYGIERAAQRYFNKSASKLNVAESAFLAGVVKAPSELADRDNRDDAIRRQKVVLGKMVEYGFISAAEADAAKKEKLNFRKFVSPYQQYPHYVSTVMDMLRARFPREEINKGMKVYTHLDPLAQRAGEKALSAGIAKAPRGVTQAALVSVDVNDGGVRALVGGVGQFEKFQWNRATSPHTLGSSFKPFVYLTGFMAGMGPEDIVNDTPFSMSTGYETWAPKNFDNTFKGPMTMRKALAMSRNVCAVRVADAVGIKQVINTARLAGISSRLDPYLPISLGAGAASPLEMAGAFSTFARYGVQMDPQVIRRIERNNGDVLAVYDVQPKKVFESDKVAQLISVMQTAVNNGTGQRAKLKDRPVAGKTGTTDGSRDIWFVGFTPDLVTAVWGGNDYNQKIANNHVTGGMVMAGMWKAYTEKYYAEHPTPITAFISPQTVEPGKAKIALGLDEPTATGTKIVDEERSGDEAEDGEEESTDEEKTETGSPRIVEYKHGVDIRNRQRRFARVIPREPVRHTAAGSDINESDDAKADSPRANAGNSDSPNSEARAEATSQRAAAQPYAGAPAIAETKAVARDDGPAPAPAPQRSVAAAPAPTAVKPAAAPQPAPHHSAAEAAPAVPARSSEPADAPKPAPEF